MLEAVEAAAEIFVTHTTNKDNPHKVTKEQVGLGNVDNTSDMDKPVSSATISAIETLRQETQSAINTFKDENSAAHTDIYSAIKTFKNENSAAHEIITNELTTLIETETNHLTSRIDDIARRFQIPYITEGSMDDLTEEGVYLIGQQVDGFPSELFEGGLYLYLGLLKVVKREIDNTIGIVQYIGASFMGLADTQTIYGARSWTEEDGWSEWDSDTYFLDISYTTMVSKETTLKNTKSFVVTDEKGIKTIPASAVAAGSHTHDYLVSRPNCIEFLPIGTSKHGGFLDFHYEKSTADYTSRIIEDASGKISVIANNGFFVNGLAVNTAPRVTVADGVTWIETPLSNGKSMLYGMAVKSGNGDGLASNLWKMVPPKSIDNTTVKFTANALVEDNNSENSIYEEWSVLTYGNLAAGSYKNIMVVKGDIKATKFLLTMQAITK